MENGILKGWTMLTKNCFVIFLLVFSAVLSAQGIKRMTDEEFSYYEYLLRNNLADRYRTPNLQKDAWLKLLADINKQVIDAKIPKSIDGWKTKGQVQVPSRNQIRVLALRLDRLIADPELQEVTGVKQQWFKNVGKAIVELANFQKRMIAAVEQGRGKEYAKLLYSYKLNVENLKKLLNSEDSWKIPRKELALIRRKNTEVRKKKMDELARRYDYTRKLKSQESQNSRRDNRNRRQQQRNNRRGARR